MRATRIAQEKIKVERAKRQLARERARAIAARRLDPFHGQPTRSVYSYAPHRTYGPFNNGWGNGWNAREILLKKSEADH
jgi:hypothetical protein